MKAPLLVQQALNQAGLQGDWAMTPVAGGDTARCGVIEDGANRYFVKQHRNPLLLEAEALGLETLASTLRVPRVVHCHSAPEGGVLLRCLIGERGVALPREPDRESNDFGVNYKNP